MTDALNPMRIHPSHAFLAKGSAGLPKNSITKAEQIRAIQVSRVVGYYGRLSAPQVRDIDNPIKITLALR